MYDEKRLKQEVDPEADREEENRAGFRYPTLVFWVHAAKDVLCTRLDSRVDKMIQKGLLDEVKTLSDFLVSHETQTGKSVDQGRGIWVSIGYKEFLDYQAALNDPAKSEKDLASKKSAAIERTQAATRQYAKRQVRWIQIKLLNALINAGQLKNTFLMDGSDVSKWDDMIARPALDITGSFLNGEALPDSLKLSPAASEMLTPRRNYDLSERPDLWQKKICEACGTLAVNENDWNLHIKSRAHKRAVGAKKKSENAPPVAARRAKVPQEDLVDVLTSYLHTFDNPTSDQDS